MTEPIFVPMRDDINEDALIIWLRELEKARGKGAYAWDEARWYISFYYQKDLDDFRNKFKIY